MTQLRNQHKQHKPEWVIQTNTRPAEGLPSLRPLKTNPNRIPTKRCTILHKISFFLPVGLAFLHFYFLSGRPTAFCVSYSLNSTTTTTTTHFLFYGRTSTTVSSSSPASTSWRWSARRSPPGKTKTLFNESPVPARGEEIYREYSSSPFYAGRAGVREGVREGVERDPATPNPRRKERRRSRGSLFEGRVSRARVGGGRAFCYACEDKRREARIPFAFPCTARFCVACVVEVRAGRRVVSGLRRRSFDDDALRILSNFGSDFGSVLGGRGGARASTALVTL